MAGIITAALRGSALLWTLLITALIGNALATNDDGPTTTLNWTLFVAAWSWITSLYGLVAVFIAALAFPIVLVALDGFATLVTLIGAIVLSAMLTAVDCGDIGRQDKDWIGFGSGNTEKRCREIQASTVFMWFLWATYCAILFLLVRDWRGGFGARSSKPNMSQVAGV